MKLISPKPYNHTKWGFCLSGSEEKASLRIEVATLFYPRHPLNGSRIYKAYSTKMYKDGTPGKQKILYISETDKNIGEVKISLENVKTFPRLSDLIKHYSKKTEQC